MVLTGQAGGLVANAGAAHLSSLFESVIAKDEVCKLTSGHARRAFSGIATRKMPRIVQQRERFFASLVGPLLWLLVFAAGFRAAICLSITPPYETYVIYEVYFVPGLVCMVLLFNGMQSSLSMVYDREMGTMRVLLTSPLPRWFVLAATLIAGAVVSVVQAYAFPAIAAVYGVRFPAAGITGKSAHGLRKTLASHAAEHGATEEQLKAFFGWTTNRMSQVYTRAASRKRMAGEAGERIMDGLFPRPEPGSRGLEKETAKQSLGKAKT